VHNTASDPGASCTVVRIRHSAAGAATGSAAADDGADSDVFSDTASDVDFDTGFDADFDFDSDDPVGPVRRVSAAGRAPVSPVGGAWPWRRDHHVWNPAVAINASAEIASSTGPSGPCPTRSATTSATATAVNSAASSTRSRRQWCTGRPCLARVTSDMSRLMHPL
jgi:hypothetical protein